MCFSSSINSNLRQIRTLLHILGYKNAWYTYIHIHIFHKWHIFLHSVSHHDIITPHAQRERGKVIGRGVHIYIYMSVVEKKI